MIPTRGGSNVERIHASLRLHLRTQILGARQHIGVIVGGLPLALSHADAGIACPERQRSDAFWRRRGEITSMIPLATLTDGLKTR